MTAGSPYEMAMVARRISMAPCASELAVVEADCNSWPVPVVRALAARGKSAPEVSLQSSEPEALRIRSHAQTETASQHPARLLAWQIEVSHACPVANSRADDLLQLLHYPAAAGRTAASPVCSQVDLREHGEAHEFHCRLLRHAAIEGRGQF